MKIKVHTLAWLDEGGLGCQVFPSEKDLHDRLSSIMLPDDDFDSYSEPDTAREIDRLIKAGDTRHAWDDVFLHSNLDHAADNYFIGWETIELPDEMFRCTCDERSWHGDHHDSECPLEGPRL